MAKEAQKEQKPQETAKEEKTTQTAAKASQESKKFKELQKQNKELEEKLTKEKDDYVRLMAEFETFRRRNAEDRLNLIGTASEDTIKGLLPVLDDCKRAIEILSKSSDEAAIEGTTLIYNKLMEYLRTRGLEEIEALGLKFDVDFHEAVTQFPVEDENKKGCVIDVIQTGYTLKGKVIRYAKVVVGA